MRILAHWLGFGPPLMLAALPAAALLGLSGKTVRLIELGLLAGTPGLAALGVTVLLVEQNASRALKMAQRAYVMESGEISMQGEAKALLHDPKVRAAYLGE